MDVPYNIIYGQPLRSTTEDKKVYSEVKNNKLVDQFILQKCCCFVCHCTYFILTKQVKTLIKNYKHKHEYHKSFIASSV